VAVAFSVVGVGALFLIRSFWPSLFFSLTSPLFSIGNAVSSSLVSEEELRLIADRILLNENTSLREEVKELKKLLGSEDVSSNAVIAGVIARPPLTPYDVVLVGVGSDDGVSPGVLVSAQGGVPIGVVETAAMHHARIALFSSAGRKTEGWTGEEKIPVTLEGEGAGAFIAEVPRDAEISEGSLIYVPGPGSRPIGKVVRIDADASSPVATLRIEPLVNIFSVTQVRIELP